jgi:hypothetical protein
MSNRNSRTTETREADQRKVSWSRPSMLPVPEPRPGIEYRWIRTSTLGQSDNTNVSSRFREGWTPVRAEDHPNLQVVSDIDSRFTDNIEVGGLLLVRTQPKTCKLDVMNKIVRPKARCRLLITATCATQTLVCPF